MAAERGVEAPEEVGRQAVQAHLESQAHQALEARQASFRQQLGNVLLQCMLVFLGFVRVSGVRRHPKQAGLWQQIANFLLLLLSWMGLRVHSDTRPCKPAKPAPGK